MTLLQDLAAWALLLFGILVAAWMALTGELGKAQGDWE